MLKSKYPNYLIIPNYLEKAILSLNIYNFIYLYNIYNSSFLKILYKILNIWIITNIVLLQILNIVLLQTYILNYTTLIFIHL